MQRVQMVGRGKFSDIEEEMLDALVYEAVHQVRNLLHVACPPPSHIPSGVLPRDSPSQRPLKPAQTLMKPALRKVTAALSKLVLSARALQYNSGVSGLDAPQRIEGDAEDLDSETTEFVHAIIRCYGQKILPGTWPKALRGVYSTDFIGLELVGAGFAASWKGFGWVLPEHDQVAPSAILRSEVVAKLRELTNRLEVGYTALVTSLGGPHVHSGWQPDSLFIPRKNRLTSFLVLWSQTQSLSSLLFDTLQFMSNIHVARHVDIDGIRQDAADLSSTGAYSHTVQKSRKLIRSLEFSMQSLFDDGAELLMTAQTARLFSNQKSQSTIETLARVARALISNANLAQHTFEALLSVGHEQAELAQGDYRGSIDWRMSRLSVVNTRFAGSGRPLSSNPQEDDSDAKVDMEDAFTKRGPRGGNSRNSMLYGTARAVSGTTVNGPEAHSVARRQSALVNTPMNILVSDIPPDSPTSPTSPVSQSSPPLSPTSDFDDDHC